MSTPSLPGGAAAGRSPSIALRAILALVLLVGFYAMALGIAAGMLWLCYAMVVYGERIPIKLLILLFFSALAILWSLLPRIDRFVAPGPQLLPEQHPRLFKEIEQVAAATGQAMPVEVYLEGDVNAWVTQRGGIMGIGSRRVMGLGLALMRILDVSELRAVLAHEFGHYHGGDTRLGPWIYKTRSAIGRTISSLGESLLQKPFLLYGKMFLRVTHAISRRQEFAADHLAASVIGKEPLVTGLQKVHGAGMAFGAYWESEVVPVLSAGFRPPMAEGFVKFLKSSAVSTAVGEQLKEELRAAKVDPYDTHPPLAQRIAAVRDLPARPAAADKMPAIKLLSDVAGLERALLAAIAGAAAVSKLADTDWASVGQTVYVPLWQRIVDESRQLLAGLTPEAMPAMAEELKANRDMPNEGLQRRIATAGAAMTLAALYAGASLECDPGAPVTVANGSVRAEPFNAVRQLAEGKFTPAAWRAQCESLGIAGLDLSSLPMPVAEPAST